MCNLTHNLIHVTLEELQDAARHDDLNDAVAHILDRVDPEHLLDGGVADMVFAGAYEQSWPSATTTARVQMLNHWLGVEISYAPEGD